MLTTMQDLLNLQDTDAATITTDTQTISTDQAALTAAQGQLTTDQATQLADSNTLDAALVETGPVGSVVGNTVTIVAAPGTAISANTPYPLASSVPIPAPPAPAPTPAPAPSS